MDRIVDFKETESSRVVPGGWGKGVGNSCCKGQHFRWGK